MAGYQGLTIRGDSHSCPLAFGLDTYYNCAFDCAYCCFLGLNEVWGKDHRELDVPWFKRKILNGLKNNRPKSPLAHAIRHRKTLRLGNKYDPLPPKEKEKGITREVLEFLIRLGWDIKLETKNSDLVREYSDLLIQGNVIVTMTVLVGLDRDWEVLEGRRTPPPRERISTLGELGRAGLQVGIITEPFIPGYHTVQQFRELVQLAGEEGIQRFNTYNLRLTPFVARRLLEAGVDAERVWDQNQDGFWKKTLAEILDTPDVVIGCPDFANAGRFPSGANTCCGVDVQAPCTFNIINWRRLGMERGQISHQDFKGTWDGVGDFEEGARLFEGREKDYYTLRDTGIFERKGDGWTLN